MPTVQVVRGAPIGPNVVQVKRVGNSVQVIRAPQPAPQVQVKQVGQRGPVGPTGPQGPQGLPGAVQKVSGVAPDGSGNVDLSAVYLPQSKAGVVAPLVADSGATDNLAALQALHDNAAAGTTILVPLAPAGSYYGLSGTLVWSKPNVHLRSMAPARLSATTGAVFKPIGTIAGPMIHRTTAATGSHMYGLTFAAGTNAQQCVLDEGSDSQIDQCHFEGGTVVAYDGGAAQRNDYLFCTVMLGGGAGGIIFSVDSKIFGGRYYGNKVVQGGGNAFVGVHFDGGNPNVTLASAAARTTFTGCEFDGCEGTAVIVSQGPVIHIAGGRIWADKASNTGVPLVLWQGGSSSYVDLDGVLVDCSNGTPSFIISYGVSGTPTAAQNNAAAASRVSNIRIPTGVSAWDIQPGYTAAIAGRIAPAVSAGPNAGTGATAAVTGTNKAGLITLTSGTSGMAGGTQCTLTYTAPRGQLPSAIIVNPANTAARTAGTYQSSAGYSTNGFSLSFASAPAASTVYTFWYEVVD